MANTVMAVTLLARFAVAHQPVVDVLATTVNTNATFRMKLEETISWYANYTHQSYSLNDFYIFLDGYIFDTPTPDDSYGYLGPLFPMFIMSPAGADLIAEKPFSDWLLVLFAARAQHLNSRASTPSIEPYLKRPDVINMTDFKMPEGGFASFQDFFGRPLADGVRPIWHADDDDFAVSPCDCQIKDIFDITNLTAPFELKRGTLDVSTLLDGDPIAEKFAGGTSVLLHLNLTDYHRYHAPVSGVVHHMSMMGGLYIAKPYGVNWFYPFHRGAVIVDSPVAGLVGVVPVGMFDVGSVILDSQVGGLWKKGGEFGHFAFGGSAIVVLFGPDVAVTELPEIGANLRMGGQFAKFAPKVTTV